MSRIVTSYRDSIAYILHEYNEFNYIFYCRNFCNGMTRNHVATKFQTDLDEALFDIDSINPSISRWIQEQKAYDYPALNSKEVDGFWILEEEQINYYTTLRRKNDYEKDLHKMYMSSRLSRPVTRNYREEFTFLNHNVVEGDSLVFFNERSIASILKSRGKELFSRYKTLKGEEQVLCGYSLNGILDLTHMKEDGQKLFFSQDQWGYLNQYLGSNQYRYLSKVHNNAESKILEIIKEIKYGNEEEAYYLSLEYIRHAHSKDKCIFKILSHIINAYRERTYIFTNPLDKVSELDFMLKLWSEILELLFGDENNLYINWGETVPDTTTAIKRINNDNKRHTIGCKVDGRVVCKLSKVADTCHIEAAKASVDSGKIYSDKFKLAVESKCTIDDIVMSGQIKGQKYVPMYSMQIYGLQAEICCLKFVDRGFYLNTIAFDLSLMNNLEGFSKNMLKWVKQLLTFKKMCVNVSSLSTQAFNEQQSTFADVFQRDDGSTHIDKYCNPDWVTGTFLPPTKDGPILPKQIITSADIKTQNRSLKYKEVVLEDGTIVFSKFNKDKEAKRKSRDIVEKAKNKTSKRN